MMNISKKISGVFIFMVCLIVTPSLSIARGAPESFADLSEKLLPAVVNVYTTQNIKVDPNRSPRSTEFEDLFRRFMPPGAQEEGRGGSSRPHVQQRRSLGSGFIIDASGIIITNNHVIKDADEVSIKLHDGTELKATVIGKDDKVDLAVLKVETDKDLPFVNFGDDTKSRVGDWVLAIGNPFDLGGTVTAGIISTRNRDIHSGPYDQYIQTDASINRGNSGGPMFNMDGEVIGINTAIYSQSGGNIGIGFAIPSTQAAKVISQLREFGHTKRGRIGVRISTVTDEIAESLGMDEAIGAMVNSVEDDSPASRADVKFGDIIIEFDGQKIETQRELPTVVANTVIGKTVKMVVLRKGEKLSLKITIEELDESQPQDGDDGQGGSAENAETVLGLTLNELDDQARTDLEIGEEIHGVLITAVDYDLGVEELRQIRRGDVIVEVTQKEVSSVDDVKEQIASLKKAGRKVILLSLYRRGTYFHVPLKLDDEEE